jgi:hypothetical protein
MVFYIVLVYSILFRCKSSLLLVSICYITILCPFNNYKFVSYYELQSLCTYSFKKLMYSHCAFLSPLGRYWMLGKCGVWFWMGDLTIILTASCFTNTLNVTLSVIVFLLYAFFWVIHWRLKFTRQCFWTHCPFHLRRRVGMKNHTYPPMKMEQTVCSETLAYKLQTLMNHPEESTQHSEHGESLKSRAVFLSLIWITLCKIKTN